MSAIVGLRGASRFEVEESYTIVVGRWFDSDDPFELTLQDGYYGPKGEIRKVMIEPRSITFVQDIGT